VSGASSLEHEGFVISSELAHIDFDAVYRWISVESYWAKGRSMATVRASFERSRPFVVHRGDEQVACCRVVTDEATFAWICDVFVDEAFRARGIGQWMVGDAVAWCRSIGLKRAILATRDAHGVYEKLGFRPLVQPERWMEIALR
jgi:GNAT superfamily N-acetyltransferase